MKGDWVDSQTLLTSRDVLDDGNIVLVAVAYPAYDNCIEYDSV